MTPQNRPLVPPNAALEEREDSAHGEDGSTHGQENDWTRGGEEEDSTHGDEEKDSTQGNEEKLAHRVKEDMAHGEGVNSSEKERKDSAQGGEMNEELPGRAGSQLPPGEIKTRAAMKQMRVRRMIKSGEYPFDDNKSAESPNA